METDGEEGFGDDEGTEDDRGGTEEEQENDEGGEEDEEDEEEEGEEDVRDEGVVCVVDVDILGEATEGVVLFETC